MNKNSGSFALGTVLVSKFLLPMLLFVFLLGVLTPTQADAAPPKGAEVVLVSEHKSNIPGIAKVIVQRLTLEPGVVWKDVKVKGIPFCDATKGVVTVTDQKTGATMTFGVGSRWAPAEGMMVTLSNTGDTIHEHYITRIVRN